MNHNDKTKEQLVKELTDLQQNYTSLRALYIKDNAELKDREFNYRTIVNSGQALIWTSGTDKLCDYFNEVWLKYTGRTIEQEIGNGWAEGVHPEDFDYCLDVYVTAFDKRVPFSMIYRLRRADGQYRWLLDEGSPRYNNAGVFIGYVGHCLDITEHKLSEINMQEISELNNSLLKTIPFGMDIVDEQGNILFMSDKLQSLVGEIPKESKCWHTYRDDKKQCNDCPLNAGITIGKTSTYEAHNVLGGNVFEVSHTGMMYKGKKALLEIFLNITARKSAEEQSLKLSSAVEHSPASIVITNIDGKIEYVNLKFSQVTGYLFAEALGENPRILKSGAQSAQFYTELWQTILAGDEWHGEFQNKKKNGETYWEYASISAIKNSAGTITHFVAVKEDITERKQSELIIQQKNNQLTDLNATKDKFFGIIAHDLKNPFNAILGYSEMLAQKIKSYDTEKIQQIAESINISASNTFKLLENLLEWSRLQQGQIIPYFQKCNLKNLIDVAIVQSSEMAANKNITIVINVAATQNASCDEHMTSTVVRNLLSNAIKFTPINGNISVNSFVINSFIEIKVIDSGVGIPKHKIPNLFRIDKSTTTLGTSNEKGSGLGLLLCYDLVEKQGGTIKAESVEGYGSEFSFTVPNYTTTDKDEETVVFSENMAKKLKILIAEDDELTSMLLSKILLPLSSEILFAKTGVEALEKSRLNADIDLIMMDIQMPILDGCGATKQIRLFNKSVIIIAQTAFSYLGYREKAIDAGCNDFITKPYNKTQIIKLISEHFAKFGSAE